MFIQQFAARATAAVNNHSADEVVTLWREPAAYDSPLTGPQRGLEALVARESMLFSGFSDLTATIEPLGQMGSAGAALVRFHGTHDGYYAGLSPSGNTISIEMAAVLTFDDDGYVVSERVFLDTAEVVRQLGGEN